MSSSGAVAIYDKDCNDMGIAIYVGLNGQKLPAIVAKSLKIGQIHIKSAAYMARTIFEQILKDIGKDSLYIGIIPITLKARLDCQIIVTLPIIEVDIHRQMVIINENEYPFSETELLKQEHSYV